MTHDTVELKSPLRKLLTSATRGRRKWKAKCLGAKDSIKTLKQNLNNARASRQRWRGEASLAKQEVVLLRQKLEQLKKGKPR